MADIPFVRTTCDCKTCVRCCKDQPGPLIPGDFERIAEHLGETPEEAKEHFWASPGALVKDSATGQVIRVGTITPKRVKTERGRRCVFLDENDRCRVHGVAPFGCAYFDTHMSNETAHKRGIWAVLRQMNDAAYQALRNALPYATSYKPNGY